MGLPGGILPVVSRCSHPGSRNSFAREVVCIVAGRRGACSNGHVTERGLYIMLIVPINRTSLYHEFKKENTQFFERGLFSGGGNQYHNDIDYH